MPTLDNKGNNNDLHEGSTNFIGSGGFGLNQRALGNIRAVMIFVDFPDLHAAPGSETAVGDHLLGNGQAQEWYRTTSHGKMTLTVDRIPGWQRMHKPSTSPDYVFGDFPKQKAFIAEAAGLFGNVDFSRYQIVYVVAANSPHFPASPAYLAHQPADVIHPAHGTIRLGVTFGHDSYTNSFINLVHETNHLLGLPDLYRYIPPESPPAFRDAGAWDLMSDIFHSKAIVGWHQHKLGWLPPTRATMFERGTYKATLSPLGQDCALAMIVVPLDHSRVYVIEQAQTDGTRPEGILVYLVDAGIKQGHGVLQVKPAATPAAPDRIPAQPFAVGGVFREGNLTVRVLRKIGVLYEVQIEVGASATTRR
jgi:M6 family metalloprotease-like protein